MNRTFWTGFLSGTTILAIGMVAVLASSGFQGNSTKIGVIDSNSVIQQIAIAKNMVEDEKNMKTDRETVMQFLQRYPVIKKEEAEKFKSLSIKANKTEADKSELEKVKGAATEAMNKFKALELKSSPTQDELKQLDEYRNRKNDMDEYLQGLVRDFQTEYTNLHEKDQNVLFELFKAGMAEVGKKQAYTVIFDKNVAPYGANDLTEDVTKTAAKK